MTHVRRMAIALGAALTIAGAAPVAAQGPGQAPLAIPNPHYEVISL